MRYSYEFKKRMCKTIQTRKVDINARRSLTRNVKKKSIIGSINNKRKINRTIEQSRIMRNVFGVIAVHGEHILYFLMQLASSILTKV